MINSKSNNQFMENICILSDEFIKEIMVLVIRANKRDNNIFNINESLYYQLFEILVFFYYKFGTWLFYNAGDENVRKGFNLCIQDIICDSYKKYHNKEQLMSSIKYRLDLYISSDREKNSNSIQMMSLSNLLGYARQKENLDINRNVGVVFRDPLDLIKENSTLGILDKIFFHGYLVAIKKVLKNNNIYNQSHAKISKLFYIGLKKSGEEEMLIVHNLIHEVD